MKRHDGDVVHRRLEIFIILEPEPFAQMIRADQIEFHTIPFSAKHTGSKRKILKETDIYPFGRKNQP